MREELKRFFGALLALAMIVSLISAAADATESELGNQSSVSLTLPNHSAMREFSEAAVNSVPVQTMSAEQTQKYDPSDLIYYGDASIVDGNIIQLTPLDFHQNGSVWIDGEFDTKSRLTASFSYWAGGGHDNWAGGADGIVFMFSERVILGGDGSEMAFTPGAVGVELDSYYYEYDYGIDGKHIAIIQDAFDNHLAYRIDNRVDDELWHDVLIEYSDNQMDVYLDNDSVMSVPLTLPDTVRIGACAATGNGYNQHLLKNITITATPAPDSTSPSPSGDDKPNDAYVVNNLFVEDNVARVSVISNTAENARLFVASYAGNGKFLTAVSVDITPETVANNPVELSLNTSGAAYVSAFILGGDGNMKPLCPKKSQNL